MNVFAGHAVLLPSQTSCTSQIPATARHTVLVPWRVSLGHAEPLPVQVSCGSQTPALARHTVLDDEKLSDGHVALLPLQNSAGSQTPALARHTVPGTEYVMTTRPLPVFTPAVFVCAVPALYEPPPPPYVE